MRNLFDQPPVLQKPQKQDVCEHGNPKGLCELCSIIDKVDLSPITNSALAKEIGIDHSTLKIIANKYRDSNPEYFQNKKHEKKGKILEHYSPELALLLKEEVLRVEKAPEGWHSNKYISLKMGVSQKTSRKIAENYRQSNPEYFKEYKDKSGKKAEHYAPELIEIIIKKILENEVAPAGWKTNNVLAKELKMGFESVQKVTDNYRRSNPEYFKQLKTEKGMVCEHYSPELIETIRTEISKFESAPDEWKTNSSLAKELGMAYDSVQKIAENYRQSNPEYFKYFKDISTGKIAEYYSQELVEIIKTESSKFPNVPEGWKSNSALSGELGISYEFLRKIADNYRQSGSEHFKQFKTGGGKGGGKIVEHYSPELIETIRTEISKFESAPDEWKTNSSLAKELGMAYDSVQKIAENYRQSNPEYFKYFKDKVGKVTEHYASGLVEIIFRDAFKIEIAPEGWKTKNTLANELSVAERTVSRIADKYRESNPNYFKKFKLGNTGSVYEHFSPILADIVRAELLKVEKAPVGWKTNKKISNELSVSADAIKHVARDYLKTNPEYFKNYRDEGRRIFLHYSPELVQIIKNVIEAKKIEKVNGESEEKLKQSLEDFVQELSDKETNDEKAKKLREIISLLPENACDILFKYHPEYKGLHADYVRSVIAEYLGDFLLVRKAWETKDIKMAEELFFEEQFAEALFLKFKDASLAFFQKEKKSNPKANEYELVMRYFQNEKIQESALRIPELQKTIDRLKKYYAEIFQLAEKKPANIVDSLREGRVFPDINQLINIKELAEVRKKNEGKENEEDLGHKLLIADEMGLGKSASAILAKEYFGLKCAVIVMPSNVEETWQGYLSDNISDGGKQEGYFRKGSAPKVLTIENQKDLERLKTGVFDYILISQEKMAGEHYFEALRNFDFDMLIIDEVHKLKNIEEGVRSENVVRLSEKIQGQDKYLAMLSGTPIPNKVKDLAVILKLLYPERYKDSSDQYLINHIIYGDLMKLRQELFSRMQMKELTSSIEIPEPEFKDVRFDLSDEENEVYQILLEEDELTASGKIIMFRQFLLNPQLLGVEPGFEGSKVRELKEMLAEDLKSKNKIIVFVNSYIDGVIRDKEDKDTGEILTESIISKLNLPSGIKWKTIHGKDKDKDNYRKEVQKEFNADNEEKMILFVSGDTADVGVDFSGADELIFYNEPWSKYDKKQQEGRSQREGRRGVLVVKTLIARGTIEEGIRRYIDAKEKAIEKLLRGFDRTKSENNLLRKDANSKKRDLEADKDLSKDYISEWEKLMLHFGKGWEAGGRWFKEMPEDEKESYAKLYREAGGLSYQGNNARASVSLIEKMIAEKDKNGEKLRILDIASGPEMLKRHAAKDLHNQIYSMDINERHFDETIDARRTFKKSYLNLPVRSGSVDYYNIGFAFHQTKQIKFYKKNYERLQVLAEMNRVLKVGGRAIISEIHNAEFVNPGKLEELIEKLGFRMVKKYSGEADGGENYRSHFITLEKIAETPGYGSDMFRLSDEEKQAKIKELGEVLDKDLLNGLEIRKTAKSGRRLKDQRRMIEKFKLGNKEIKIAFTSEDEKLFLEEKKAIKDGEALSQRFDGKIYDIPLEEMYKIGFKRKLQNPNLMYKIIENGGAVVVRGDKKKRKNK